MGAYVFLNLIQMESLFSSRSVSLGAEMFFVPASSLLV